MNSEILSYIPQRPPFIMIGELLYSDELVTRTSFTIPAGHLFVTDGFFTEPGLIENMAQTAGAGTGYRIIQSGGNTPMGYIAALRNVHIIELPKANDTIITETTSGQNVMNIHMVSGTIHCNEKLIATCEFKIFMNNATDSNAR